MPRMKMITPCLWFDNQAEEAARFYTSIFPNSKITHIDYYPEAGHEIHGGKAGSVLTVAFELDGQEFLALNGGPVFKFSEAVSFMIPCRDQAEIDQYWNKMSADPKAEQCGWIKDKFGLSWQIVPADMEEIMDGPNREAAFTKMLQMKKLDIAGLKAAA